MLKRTNRREVIRKLLKYINVLEGQLTAALPWAIDALNQDIQEMEELGADTNANAANADMLRVKRDLFLAIHTQLINQTLSENEEEDAQSQDTI